MFLKLFLVFTIVPIAELYLLIKIGGAIGAPQTILLIFLTGVAGASLARYQGLHVVRQMQRAVEEGKIPADEMIQGLLILIGGFTLLTPGFITDLIGLSMLLPWTRRALSRRVRRFLERHVKAGNVKVFTAGPKGGYSSPSEHDVIDIE